MMYAYRQMAKPLLKGCQAPLKLIIKKYLNKKKGLRGVEIKNDIRMKSSEKGEEAYTFCFFYFNDGD